MSTSRVVTISAISMRGGASRMSIPDGSRQSTSARSDSAIRSVGRSRIDGASVGTAQERAEVAELEAPVDEDRPVTLPGCGDRKVERNRRLPTPPFGAKTAMHVDRALPSPASCSLKTWVTLVHEVVAGERHRQDALDAAFGIELDGLLGDREHDHRDLAPAFPEAAHHLICLDPTLEQGVHDDDVGSQLRDLEARPCRRR